MDMSDFNLSQKLAINHTDGTVLVLAGPGSGKTLVIVHRVYNLIRVQKISAENILVATFSRAAAGEMEERFLRLCHEPVTFGIFHSIFLKILKEENFPACNIIEGIKKYEFIKKTVLSFLPDFNCEKLILEKLINEISLAKNSLPDISSDITSFSSECLPPGIFINVFKAYNQLLYDNRYIDFDDILIKAYSFLRSNPASLDFWRNKYKYILIDEFQDINLMQYKVMKLLAYPLNNIFVVGDDDQSIYGFRGATPGIMKSFLNEYFDAKQVLLNINYRSNKKITKKAMHLISANSDRLRKKIRSHSKSGNRAAFRLINFKTHNDECNYITDEIIELIKPGIKAEEIAVLFRSIFDCRLFIKELTKKEIPFIVKTRQDDLSGLQSGSSCKINIMTMHASKGLEFDIVYIPCMVKGLMPHKKAKLKEEISEERRILYVAMTRARHRLTISRYKKTGNKKAAPSKFLDSL